jgi:hypothetical protein
MPQDDCCDRIELNMINQDLRNLFRRYQEAAESDRDDSTACHRVEVEICLYIKGCIKLHKARQEADINGWLVDIDFRALLNRVVVMKDDLQRLIFTEGILSDNRAQQQFNEDIQVVYNVGLDRGLKLFSKATSAPRQILLNSYPG